jgi:hypothetical protein
MSVEFLAVACLLALILAALACNLWWLRCCHLLLEDLRSHQGDLRAIILGQHQSTTGSLNALHEEVRQQGARQKHGPRLTEIPPSGEEC